MAVSPPPAPSSIDLSGLPPRVVEPPARVLALCREELRSEPRPEAPEEVELRVREATNEFARDVMGAVIENRDDGASRIERDGQSWFRVAVTPKTIMTSLGPVTYRRARYRSGASGASPVPVDESLGLVDDYLTRPAAELGLLMMGHCTAREAAAFFAKTGAMTPSVSTLQRLTLSMHECWESLGPETLGSIREAEGIPQDATTASVSLDGVMVPLRPGEDGRAKAAWREAACGTVSFHDAEGKRLKTLYLGRMPESGKLTLKAQLASEVAHIRRARPEIGIVAIADGAADNWTFLETLSPETEVIDFWHACEHLQTASDHAVAPGWFEKYREILRHDPRGVAKVIRALRHLRDAAAAPDRAETERELAFFRKHRHRMRLPRPEGRGHRHRLRRGRGCQQDPGDTAHEALRHTLADRRRTGCSDLPRPDQIRPLRAGMEGPDQRNRHTGQRQHQSTCSSHGNRCQNSTNQAADITAMRNSHPPRSPPGRVAISARRGSRMAASCRVMGSSRGAPVLVSSTRKTSPVISTRSHRSGNTSFRRIPVYSPNRNASLATGAMAPASMPFFQRGSTSAGAEILRRFGG